MDIDGTHVLHFFFNDFLVSTHLLRSQSNPPACSRSYRLHDWVRRDASHDNNTDHRGADMQEPQSHTNWPKQLATSGAPAFTNVYRMLPQMPQQSQQFAIVFPWKLGQKWVQESDTSQTFCRRFPWNCKVCALHLGPASKGKLLVPTFPHNFAFTIFALWVGISQAYRSIRIH